DVLATFDDRATVATDAAALLVDRLPMMVGFVGQFTPRDTRPADDTTIAVTTSEPVRDFELELGERADLRAATGVPTTGALGLPATAGGAAPPGAGAWPARARRPRSGRPPPRFPGHRRRGPAGPGAPPPPGPGGRAVPGRRGPRHQDPLPPLRAQRRAPARRV